MAGGHRYEPARALAVLGIVVGAALIVFGVVAFATGNRAFLVSWCAVVVAITALDTWAAFSRRGSLGTWTRLPDEQDRP
ncbi:hypothetical protein GCU56_02080 [Geodermatophilus sabuli]|uniref:Uncharacterized protein n=1 Tax=Geodermatophilus sabuli TaxID=1564158 RepID=A0A7K3VX76_9ACTN|nr:hypothetical protein [Geodermatophilus sabuli]NEK56663.1 hypothetical protein [Geodermatophilus sabuli]